MYWFNERTTERKKNKIIHKLFFFGRKPDLDVDPENVKIRESPVNESVSLDNRFSETESPQIKCGQQLDDRIVGGELCEIDKYFFFSTFVNINLHIYVN